VAKKRKLVELDLGQRLRDSERQATSMSLPLAIQHRLDVLAELADNTSATRAEIIGALIGEAPVDSEQLEELIMRYRKKVVEDVIPEQRSDSLPPGDMLGDNVVALERRGPGRPGRKTG
jgi:predicted DNA-binding protein